MRVIAFGGDERMGGALASAHRAGWETAHVRREEEMAAAMEKWDAVMLPWPHSFREDTLSGGELSKERVLSLLPPCRVALHGSGVEAGELPQAANAFNPAGDEGFLRDNAELTAEGALWRAMSRPGRAILGSTCVITGYGRIGRALCRRLLALGAFVIVCARNEGQMRSAHEAGAHPVPLASLVSACRQADVVFNTVPAHVLGEAALLALDQDALVIDLASAPYGMDLKRAAELGVAVVVDSGVPGRYAPRDAGAALFGALQRAVAACGGKGE